MDPWGNPAKTSAHEENWPFKTTLCFRSIRKSFIGAIKFPETPFCLSLKIKASCQTLSKALDMSRNTPLTS